MNRRQVRGPAHPHYRSGMTRDGFGYVQLSSLEHGANVHRREHQVVAEATIGRPLARDEVVHHLNGNKADNRPENLLVVTRADHARLHHARGEYVFCRSCGARKWLNPFQLRKLGPKGYGCRPCGGRWA